MQMTQKTIETTMAGWKGLFLLLPGAHSTVPTAPSASTNVNKQVQTNNHKMKDSPTQTTRARTETPSRTRARPPNPPAPYSTLHLPARHYLIIILNNLQSVTPILLQKVQLWRKVQKSPRNLQIERRILADICHRNALKHAPVGNPWVATSPLPHLPTLRTHSSSPSRTTRTSPAGFESP